MTHDIKSDLRQFIETAANRKFADGESLLDSGVLNSMVIVKLIAYMESRFDIVLGDEVFEPKNFETIEAMSTLVTDIRQAT